MTGSRFVPAALVVAAGLLLGACSRPQEPSKTAADEVTQVKLIPPYESLDKDKDGIVTLAEVDAVAPDWTKQLRSCDTDRDKTLTRSEYDVCRNTSGSH